MSAWIIYDKNGLAKCEARKLTYSGEFLGACSVSVNITSPTPIGFELGDWLEYRGERFELNYDPSVVKESSSDTYGEGFQYENIVFNSLADELTRCDFLDYVPKDNEIHYSSLPTFSFFADSIAKLAERIQANLDRIYAGDKKWTVEVHPEYVNTLNVNITASNNTVWDALGFVNSKFGANFIIRGRKITIGTTGLAVGRLFSYGKGNGLYKIERNAESNQKVITRLRAYGSTRNMPTDYYHNVSGGNIPNNMAVRNLMLPSFPVQTHDPYIDSKNIGELGVREGTVFFDGSSELEEIYPTMEGMTSEDLKKAGVSVNAEGRLDEVVGAEQITDDGKFATKEGEEQVTVPDFTISLKDVGFDLNDYLGTSSATISMKDGMCGGRDFEIVKCEKEGDGYKLTCHRHYDESLDLYFPYSSYQIKGGDKFVLLNIEMPDVYIKTASQRLLNAATAYLAKNDYVRYSYTLSVDNIFMARQHDEASINKETSIHDVIKEGDLMLFEDEDLGINGSITISSLSIKENADESIIPEYEITLQDEKTVGTIEKIQNQITNIISFGGGSETAINTEQVKSIIQAVGAKLFLSKTKDDKTPFSLGVGKSLSVGEDLEVKGKADIQGGVTTKGDVVIGSEGYAEGFTGFGTKFSRDGSGEMSRLTLRHELRVPKLVFNSIEINVGDKWRGAGGGVIERVEPDFNTDGSMKDTGTIWLQLEAGQIGAVYDNAISQGIFHDFTNKSNNETSDSEIYEDGKMIARTFAGFTTVYFLITEISDYTDENGIVWRNKQCRYQLRLPSTNWTSTAHPYEQMNFVCYGVMSDDEELLEKYGTSAYETRTYTRLLWRQNTWEIGANNIASQSGDLSNLNILGLNAKGYSNYINSVYFTGEIRQVNPNTGEPVKTANDRGEWVNGTTYYYYDRVSHSGGLWLCVAEDGTNTEPKEGDAAWLLQVKSGTSVTAAGHWESSKVPYKVNSIVTFADKVWISNKETSNPPFGTYTDKDGNRLTYNDGGYILVETLIQSEDWDLLLDATQLTDGKDGESLQVRYSSDKSNWHSTFVEGDVWMQQRVGNDSLWSDAIRIVGEAGAAGLNGTYYDYQFAVNDSITIAPATGWQDTPPSVGTGQYLWMRTRFVNPDSSEVNPWSVVRIGGEKGEKGDSISNMGAWKTGMAVPYLGMVTMGGKTFISKVATNNPPMWTWTDKDGNRLIYKDGGYILTGELNTDEYDLVMQDGKDGRDGKGYEYIYIHSKTEDKPSKPTSEQKDDYIPTGWHDDPIGVTESIPYEWVCVRIKKDGIWSDYSTPALWAKFGKDGINGLQGIQGEKGEQGIQGEKGADGKTSYFHIKYADDANGKNMNESGGDYIGTYVDFVQSDSTDPKKYTWVKTKGAQGEKGDQGIAGTNGENGQTSYLHIAYANSADGKTGFSVSDSTGKLYIGQYTDFLLNDSTDPTKYKWTLIKGEDGEGFTMMGNWKTGLVVPKMGVVTMKGGSYAAKLATTNPPFWCWTDNLGNRLVFSATEYILTGESNSEYETFAAQGEQGEKGETGEKGEQGEKGDKGDKGDQGTIGYTGCVTRVFQEYSNTQVYRNDTNATPEELDVSGIRYLDMLVLATEDLVNYPSGYVAFECLKTHSGHSTTESKYWRAFSSNIASQFVPKLVALDAHLRFASSGQVVILDEKQKPCAGMAGSQEGDKTRIWAGSDNPDNAPFAVNQSGETTASKFRTARNGLRMEAANGLISIFGSLAKNIEFGINEEGLAVMRYYDNDGTLLYDLGPSGISSVKRDNDTWNMKRLTFLGAGVTELFTNYWNTAKNPLYNTGYDRWQYLSGFVGGIYDDAANNRKIFKSKSKKDASENSNVIDDGWYCDSLPKDVSQLNRIQYPNLDGAYPDDMSSMNPNFDPYRPIYVTSAFYVLDGLIINRMNVYYNL